MITATTAYSIREYALLGKLLFQKEPETAQRLIQDYLPSEKPSETDHAKIQEFFLSFCQLNNLDPKAYIGPLYKTSKVDVRRKFIAVIIQLYSPRLYKQSLDVMVQVVDNNLTKTLAEVLQQKKSNISMMIREVITWMKNYDEFQTEVHNTIQALTYASTEE